MTLRAQAYWPVRYEMDLGRSWRFKPVLEAYEEWSRFQAILTWRALKECI